MGTTAFLWCCVAAVLCVVLELCSGFNIDLPSRVVHSSDQADSMFGFAVAMHRDKQGVHR